MAGYVAGALLAGFALAFLPLKIDDRGFLYSGPLSVMCVFAMVWHQPWTHYVCWAFGVIILLVWALTLMSQMQLLGALSDEQDENPRFATMRDWSQTFILAAGVALMLWLNYYGYWKGPPAEDGLPTVLTIAWPWYAPVGSTVAFVWGYLLARRRVQPVEPVTV